MFKPNHGVQKRLRKSTTPVRAGNRAPKNPDTRYIPTFEPVQGSQPSYYNRAKTPPPASRNRDPKDNFQMTLTTAQIPERRIATVKIDAKDYWKVNSLLQQSERFDHSEY